jgi:hypothetical protein
MATLNDVLTTARPTAIALVRAGLRTQIGARYAIIDALLRLSGFGAAPRIISGRRSIAAQADLLQKYLRGQLSNKPAAQSWHTEGLAIDLDISSPTFPVFVHIWKIFGGRWGGNFRNPDRPHFDFPLPGIIPRRAF